MNNRIPHCNRFLSDESETVIIRLPLEHVNDQGACMHNEIQRVIERNTPSLEKAAMEYRLWNVRTSIGSVAFSKPVNGAVSQTCLEIRATCSDDGAVRMKIFAEFIRGLFKDITISTSID